MESKTSTVNSLEAQLDALLDLDTSARAAWIDSNIDDPERRHLLLVWLETLNAGDWMEAGVDGLMQLGQASAELATDLPHPANQVIGRYRLLKQLGEGGASMVWLGERCDETAHRVAIKCLKRGLIGVGERSRFLTEQKLLARLSHPHIVRMLDADISVEGVPFTVMEWVDGENIIDHVKSLPLEQTLRLFVQLCDAVAFAHRNLVLHRDLKPGNVLVDCNGQVKLLDFGIGRVLAESGRADATLSMAMTPAYAAPEQLKGEALSTAVDVFALGAILFECLTGKRPFEGVDRMRLPDQSVATPSKAAVHPNLELNKLPDSRRDELDAIVLQAMCVEAAARYVSVDDLADDVRRFLEQRPIRAETGLRGYRFRRFAHRHRVAFSIGGLVLIGMVLATALVWRAGNLAKQEAKRAEQSLKFVESLFRAESREVTARELPTTAEILERGAQRAKLELKNDPIGQMQVLHWIGRTYLHSDRPAQAAKILAQANALALSSDETNSVLALDVSIDSLFAQLQGSLKPDEVLKQDWLQLQDRVYRFGSPAQVVRTKLWHIDWLAKTNRFAEAETELDPLLTSLNKTGDRNAVIQIAELRLRLANLLSSQSKHAAAAQSALLASQALERLADAPARLRVEARNVHALALAWNQDAKAESALRDALATSLALSSEANLLAADVEIALGNILSHRGEFDEARQRLQAAHAIRVRLLGESHEASLDSLGDLALLNQRSGRFLEAEKAYRSGMKHFENAKLVDAPARRAILFGNLADVLVNLNQLEEAETLAHQALDLRRQYLGVKSVGTAYYYLYCVAMERGNLVRALSHLNQGLQELGEPNEPHADQALLALFKADTERRLGHKDESRLSLDLAVALNLAVIPKEHLRWGLIHLANAEWQLAFGKIADARTEFAKAEPYLMRNLGLSQRQQDEISRLRLRLSLSGSAQSSH